MREKIWKDCPSCGSKGSMHQKEGVSQKFTREGTELTLKDLDGQFCDVCSDGFLSLKSEKVVSSELGKFMARLYGERVVAKDIQSPTEVAKRLKVSPARISQMMKEGKLPYVFIAKKPHPIRQWDISFGNSTPATITSLTGSQTAEFLRRKSKTDHKYDFASRKSK